MTESELLRRACEYAERDQEELLVAWQKCTDPEAEKIKRGIRRFLKALRSYRLKRWILKAGKWKGQK